MRWTTPTTATAIRPPLYPAARYKLRFQHQGRVLLSPKDCARNWKNGSARNTLAGSAGWVNFGVAYFRTRASTLIPDAEYYTSKPLRLHLRSFGTHSKRRAAVKIRGRARLADESLTLEQSDCNSDDAAVAKVSPTIRTHGDGKIGARSSNPRVVWYLCSSGLDTFDMTAHGVELLSPARSRSSATSAYSPGM